MAGTVSVSRLSGHASQVIREVGETGKATFVTKHGRPVAIIAPVDADGADDPSDHVLDHVLANAPEYVASMRQADEDLAAGRTSSMADVVADLGG
ncbi:MAG: type II toxin-antitoxin system prevent-host-death family antitoxin [Gammaproteobacteria bacterium]|nr:type II toxin-antitoxin system prevent-host-death family antitoxin [Gammaproteobacteria bacterium]